MCWWDVKPYSINQSTTGAALIEKLTAAYPLVYNNTAKLTTANGGTFT